MGDKQQIKRLVDHLVKKYRTSDPFDLANCLGILYQIGNCKHEGCYMFLKNHQYIFLSDRLSDDERRLVMAHELGHAIMHRKMNCYFIRNKTLLLNSKVEKEANLFAADLLISDELLIEARDQNYTEAQLARLARCCQSLVKLRMEQENIG